MKTAARKKNSPLNPRTRLVRNGSQDGGRLVLGEYVVADPLICHGKPTYKGTRIMVWQILDELACGMSSDEIVKAWGGRVSKAAIAETVRLAKRALLDGHGKLTRGVIGQLAA